jgi:hypothetical protein
VSARSRGGGVEPLLGLEPGWAAGIALGAAHDRRRPVDRTATRSTSRSTAGPSASCTASRARVTRRDRGEYERTGFNLGGCHRTSGSSASSTRSAATRVRKALRVLDVATGADGRRPVGRRGPRPPRRRVVAGARRPATGDLPTSAPTGRGRRSGTWRPAGGPTSVDLPGDVRADGLVARRVGAPGRARPRGPRRAVPPRGRHRRARADPATRPAPSTRPACVPTATCGCSCRAAGRPPHRRLCPTGDEVVPLAGPAAGRGVPFESWHFDSDGRRIHGFIVKPPGTGPFPRSCTCTAARRGCRPTSGTPRSRPTSTTATPSAS